MPVAVLKTERRAHRDAAFLAKVNFWASLALKTRDPEIPAGHRGLGGGLVYRVEFGALVLTDVPQFHDLRSGRH